jgi:hypothetical protein
MDARTFLADLFFVAVFFAEEEEVGGKSSDMFLFGNAWWVLGWFLGMQIIKGGLWLCSEDTEHGYKLTSAVQVSSIN